MRTRGLTLGHRGDELVFVRVLEREPEAYRLGVKPDFSLESMQHPELTPRAPRLRHAAA